jgi:hypothetical protein
LVRRLLSRAGIDEAEREAMLGSVEDRGSAYFPQVNAFYVREFKMIHAAEDATRFLHQACQGLPQRLNGNPASSGNAPRRSAVDEFYARVIEHAVAYFGSRVLYPSRPVPGDPSSLSRAACEALAKASIRMDRNKSDALARELGYRIGSRIYDAYLEGKVAPSGLRRLSLVHLNEPGVARKVCATVIAKLRSFSRPLSR